MSVASFDPSRVSGYGISGQETARKMASTLEAHSLSLTYNESNSKFTIHSSSRIDKETIAKILSKAVYKGWGPQVLDETDDLGNRLVQLRVIDLKMRIPDMWEVHSALQGKPSGTFF